MYSIRILNSLFKLLKDLSFTFYVKFIPAFIVFKTKYLQKNKEKNSMNTPKLLLNTALLNLLNNKSKELNKKNSNNLCAILNKSLELRSLLYQLNYQIECYSLEQNLILQVNYFTTQED